ncbi:glycosyltransferase family 32 protein [Tepidamorphus sp. 3E244]|uniref:glycosyltransferase family 32 protein n=1 Tax=Tepidamorphus sp. 3E244 TaxID=3385498 RepID=UPI0038FCB8DC
MGDRWPRAQRMGIPKIIHQTWKDERIPARLHHAVQSVRTYHKDWDYRLWTDAAMDTYVRENHPDFFPVYSGFTMPIMRADSFRYLMMLDFGGLYCDLDYIFLRPYDYAGCQVMLASERNIDYGDWRDAVCNFVFASEPGHPLWRDCIDSLRENPPSPKTYAEVTSSTGPGFLNRIYQAGADRYQGVRVERRIAFNPRRTRRRTEATELLNNGMTYGYHLGSGSWKERFTLDYLRLKGARLLGKGAGKQPLANGKPR